MYEMTDMSKRNGRRKRSQDDVCILRMHEGKGVKACDSKQHCLCLTHTNHMIHFRFASYHIKTKGVISSLSKAT